MGALIGILGHVEFFLLSFVSCEKRRGKKEYGKALTPSPNLARATTICFYWHNWPHTKANIRHCPLTSAIAHVQGWGERSPSNLGEHSPPGRRTAHT
eukprot:6013427-Prymnesium_polylepis.1